MKKLVTQEELAVVQNIFGQTDTCVNVRKYFCLLIHPSEKYFGQTSTYLFGQNPFSDFFFPESTFSL